jgi:D-lyxose ketol-isomerase
MRNGKIGDPNSKTYAEKIMMVRDGQRTPLHFHWHKMEDIINRGGADLLVKVYMADENEDLSDKDVPVTMDGITRYYPAGSVVRVKPGQSITMQRYLYHEFWADGGTAIVGEVSMVNDDSTDNRFYKPCGRFAAIDEDEPAEYLLCNEYPKAK